MFNLSIKILSLVAVFLLTPDCGKNGTVANTTAEPEHWQSVQLSVSGGFSGRGNGSVMITSDGKVTVDRPAVGRNKAIACEGKLSRELLSRLSDAVSKGRPDAWNMGRLNAPSPDAFGYALRLEVGKGDDAKTYKVGWYDNTTSMLPGDLKAISEAVGAARSEIEQTCK